MNSLEEIKTSSKEVQAVTPALIYSSQKVDE